MIAFSIIEFLVGLQCMKCLEGFSEVCLALLSWVIGEVSKKDGAICCSIAQDRQFSLFIM